jgi:hypothetical protein
LSGVSDELAGCEPDYWTDVENVQEEVLHWLKNQKIYFSNM